MVECREPVRVVTARWSVERRSAPSWSPPALPTTVVVPHPDDEVLMFAGLLQLQARRGVDLHILAVTDGEDAYAGADRAALAAARRDEQLDALARLGCDTVRVTRLSIPDGAVEAHRHELVDAIAAIGTPMVAAPWFHDHHTDHEACGLAAREAAGRTFAATYYGLFWSWLHTEPGLVNRQRMIRLPLDEEAMAARRLAIDAHRSQITDTFAPALLDEASLRPLQWAAEYYLTGVEPVSSADSLTD